MIIWTFPVQIAKIDVSNTQSMLYIQCYGVYS